MEQYDDDKANEKVVVVDGEDQHDKEDIVSGYGYSQIRLMKWRSWMIHYLNLLSPNSNPHSMKLAKEIAKFLSEETHYQ